MFTKILSHKYFVLPIFFTFSIFFLTENVFAEEIALSVSGNGSESSSDVKVDANSSIEASQASYAVVENSVVTSANTGNNTASSNTNGDVQIQTGSIDSATTISNESINTNATSDSSCTNCTESINSQITNNGTHSDNLIELTTSNTTSSIQVNTAHITNNVVVNANTGENVANNNNGDVTIMTGNIKVNTNIQNKNVNLSRSTLSDGKAFDPRLIMIISGNGTSSHNTIFFLRQNELSLKTLNIANIVNSNKENLNTGENSANANIGNVFIKTGNIESVIDINNENINSSFINPLPPIGGQEEQPSDEDKKPPVTTPSQVSEHNGGNGNGKNGNGNGGVGGAAEKIGEILPITGNFLLFYLTLANLMLFLMGWYLRFRSGCAPGLIYA